MTFKLTILGSSSALPTSKRYPTAHLLNVNEQLFLIDCGEGTQTQLRKYKIPLNKINHIFISHLHGDHSFGLFGYLSTLGLLGRENDMHIYSDEKLGNILNFIFGAYKNELPYKIIFHPLNFKSPENIFENTRIIVSSFPVAHKIPTCGFLFKEKPFQKNIIKEQIKNYEISLKDIHDIKSGKDYITKSGEIISNAILTKPDYIPRSYAFITDTLFKSKLAEIVKNVDLLYHEATFLNKDKKIAKQTGHTTAKQAAQFAKTANVKKLLVGHFSSRYTNMMEFETETKQIFPDTTVVNDGDTFSIEQKRVEKQ